MRESSTHIYFYTNWMSNWTPHNMRIKFNKKIFTNSEQIFMYLKALYFEDIKTANEIIVQGFDPKIAKYLGGIVSGYNEEKWDSVREDMMYISCLLKFASDKVLKSKLLKTSGKILVEASPIDRIWGVRLSEDDDRILDESNWMGRNLLGKVLMRVRDRIDMIDVNDEVEELIKKYNIKLQ